MVVVDVDVVEVEVVVDVDVDVEVEVGASVVAARSVVVGRAIVGGGGGGVEVEVDVVVRGGAVVGESAGAGAVVGAAVVVVGVTAMDCGVTPVVVWGGVVDGGSVEGVVVATVGSGWVGSAAADANGAVVVGVVPSTDSMAADCSARAAYAWCAIGVATPAVTAVEAATANRTRAPVVPARKGFRRARKRMALSRRQQWFKYRWPVGAPTWVNCPTAAERFVPPFISSER